MACRDTLPGYVGVTIERRGLLPCVEGVLQTGVKRHPGRTSYLLLTAAAKLAQRVSCGTNGTEMQNGV